VSRNEDLKQNLSAAAHLIHGSSEGRFSITYCPGGIKEEDILSVGYHYGQIKEVQEKYLFEGIQDGNNVTPDGESYYYISNPAIGLWAHESRFK
jgi:hypothetical protein